MRKFLLPLLLAMMTIIILAACGETNTNETDNDGGEVSEYKIGAVYSNTGPNSALGESEWNATKMLEEQINAEGGINGVPLKIILADDESNQEKATQEINRLINDEKVIAILGSSGSGTSLAMKGIATQLEVPMIAAAASPHVVEPIEDSKWVFKTPPSDVHVVERIYTYLNEVGISKIGTIVDSNAYGSSGLEQLEALAGDYNIEIVAKESYNTSDPDMSAQLTKIGGVKAEAIVVYGTNPGPAIIAKNTRDLGIDLPIVASQGIANASFISLAEKAAEGVVIPTGKLLFPKQIPEDDIQFEILTDFYNDYVDKFNHVPADTGSYGHDNLLLVVDALRSGATDRKAIRDFLENDIKDWVGTTGVYNFSDTDHNGLTSDSLVMAIVENGEWKLLESK